MQPTYLSLVKIFGSETRYTVPLFQRPYVWNKDDNWEPLWQDISDLADRVVSAPDDTQIRGHFLGTVVLEQVPHKTGSISTREIIDGQQRLTTLQLALHAVRQALIEFETSSKDDGDEVATKAANVASRQIAALTANPAYNEDEEKYKVWPTNEDREPFCRVMDSSFDNAPSNDASRMAQAYHFFLAKVREWLANGKASQGRAVQFSDL